MFNITIKVIAFSLLATQAGAQTITPAQQIEKYRQYFRAFDVNKSGRISLDELHLSAERAHYAFDTDRNRWLSFDEYRLSRPHLEWSISKVEFDQIDVNSNGMLSRDEARNRAARAMQLDANRNGGLEFSEFVYLAPPVIKRYLDAENAQMRDR